MATRQDDLGKKLKAAAKEIEGKKRGRPAGKKKPEAPDPAEVARAVMALREFAIMAVDYLAFSYLVKNAKGTPKRKDNPRSQDTEA